MVKRLGLGLTVCSYYCGQSATKVNGFISSSDLWMVVLFDQIKTTRKIVYLTSLLLLIYSFLHAINL